MEGRIRGSFPGGPSRTDTAPQRSGPPRLGRVSEIEERLAERRLDHQQRRRWRHTRTVVVAGLLLAAAVGGGVGWTAHRTQSDIVAAQEQARRVQDFDISKEVNRTLLNLWKMEDVEAVRNRGRAR